MISTIDSKALSNFTTTPIDDFRPRPCQNRARSAHCAVTVPIDSPLAGSISLARRLSFSRASRFICSNRAYTRKIRSEYERHGQLHLRILFEDLRVSLAKHL